MAPERITHLAWQESVKIRRQDISSADKKGGDDKKTAPSSSGFCSLTIIT